MSLKTDQEETENPPTINQKLIKKINHGGVLGESWGVLAAKTEK